MTLYASPIGLAIIVIVVFPVLFSAIFIPKTVISVMNNIASIFQHYMKACQDHTPKKNIVLLIHTLNFQHCITLSRMINQSSATLISCQIEVLSHFSRIFEHVPTNPDTLYNLYENEQMVDESFCLLL